MYSDELSDVLRQFECQTCRRGLGPYAYIKREKTS